MYEKAPVDGVFLAIQTLEEGKLIKRYHSWYLERWRKVVRPIHGSIMKW
jgi:hypothetical protein